MSPGFGSLIAALIAMGFACGVVLLVVYIRGVSPRPIERAGVGQRLTAVLRSPALSSRLAGAVLVGVFTLLLTRWPVAAAGLATLVLLWPQLFGGQRVEHRQIVQLEALVMWTESLRDTIAARASLEQAIPATAYTAPEPIRPALIRLTGLVRARVPLDRALLGLSAELADPSADKVIGSLILNVRQRGTGLGAVLTALASSARAELDQRRQISAGRSSMRRSVQLVVAITIVFAVLLVLFSRDYVSPYATAAGQFVLAVVVGIFGLGFFWMRRLAGGEAVTPFLIRPGSHVADRDVRVVGYLTGLSSSDAADLTANQSVAKARPGESR